MKDKACLMQPLNLSKNPKLYIIKFKIDIIKQPSRLYVITVEDDTAFTQPIMHNERIIFFKPIEKATQVLQLASPEIKLLGEAPNEEVVTIDIPKTLNLVRYENFDDSATVLNFLNVAHDFALASGSEIPSEFEFIFTRFANYLTFDKDLLKFFSEENIQRRSVVNCILWFIGTIFTAAKIY